MKELTIEEKAKAYDELIVKANLMIQERGNEPDGASMLSDLFPELTESEDERIMKDLLGYLHTLPNHFSHNGSLVTEWIAWLKKQGEYAKFRDSIQVGDKVIRNQDGVLINLSQLKRVAKPDEKQGEQKPVDKVKPKFKVSDWIINRTDATIMQIVNNKDFYESVEIGGQRRTDTYNYIEWDFRLWTIQDAKDGDVLAWDDSKCIALFKNIYNEDSFNSYGFVGHCTGIFEPRQSYHDIEGVHPATKEQRDLLFAKMYEAGYKWDAEKKELKKNEQKPAWSEEDEEYFDDIVQSLRNLVVNGGSEAKRYTEEEINWLKSIKDRYTWKPSEE